MRVTPRNDDAAKRIIRQVRSELASKALARAGALRDEVDKEVA
jgi:hypothetical protein